MDDRACVEFLQWALPRMQLRWPGFRRVRGQLRKRLGRRLAELGLTELSAYRELLERRPEEWRHLDALCGITISRFWRDAALFEALCDVVLPALAERASQRGATTFRCWSAGAASGEEPYSLLLAWEHRLRPRFPALGLQLLASERDPVMIERAREGLYGASSLKDLPAEWRSAEFRAEGDRFRLARERREAVEFLVHDLRTELPAGRFDLVLCRNVVFTYFDEPLQQRLLDAIGDRLSPGGALVLGRHESLPERAEGWSPWSGARGSFVRCRRAAAQSTGSSG